MTEPNDRGWTDPPAPRREIFDGAMRRRAAGDRVLLPVQPMQRDNAWRDRRWTGIAAALLLVVAAAGALLLTPTTPAAASASELTTMPALPAPGETVRVTYRPALQLASAEHLVLRAHVRTPTTMQHATESMLYQPDFRFTTTTRLERQRDGTFTGSFTMPENAVLLLLAVETPDGDAADGNGGNFWQVLVRGEDGRPAADGLLQLAMAYTGLNSLQVLEAGRAMRTHYPDRAVGAMLEMAGEAWSLGGQADALQDEWRRRVSALHGRLRDLPNLPGDDLASMSMLAAELDDPAAIEYWQQRLIREAPAHGAAMMQQFQILDRSTDPRVRLDSAEAIWRRAQSDRGQDATAAGPLSTDMRLDFLALGLQLARQAGTKAEQRQWLGRLDGLGSEAATQTALRLVRHDSLAAEAETRLRRVIDELATPSDERRRIGRTRAEQQAVDTRDRAYRMADLGRMFLRQGRTEEAAVELERAASLTEVAATLRPLADVRLARGDTAGTLDAWALLLADPVLETPARMDTIRQLAGRHFDEGAFAASLRQARERRLAAALNEGRSRRPSDDTTLADSAGALVRWRDVRREGETVVVFWSRFCSPAVERLPQILSDAEAMAARGVATILVTDEAPSREFREFAAGMQLTLPVYHDVRGELGRALGVNGTPQSYLIDRRGISRWIAFSPHSLQLQLMALRGETAAAGLQD